MLWLPWRDKTGFYSRRFHRECTPEIVAKTWLPFGICMRCHDKCWGPSLGDFYLHRTSFSWTPHPVKATIRDADDDDDDDVRYSYYTTIAGRGVYLQYRTLSP